MAVGKVQSVTQYLILRKRSGSFTQLWKLRHANRLELKQNVTQLRKASQNDSPEGSKCDAISDYKNLMPAFHKNEQKASRYPAAIYEKGYAIEQQSPGL